MPLPPNVRVHVSVSGSVHLTFGGDGIVPLLLASPPRRGKGCMVPFVYSSCCECVVCGPIALPHSAHRFHSIPFALHFCISPVFFFLLHCAWAMRARTPDDRPSAADLLPTLDRQGGATRPAFFFASAFITVSQIKSSRSGSEQSRDFFRHRTRQASPHAYVGQCSVRGPRPPGTPPTTLAWTPARPCTFARASPADPIAQLSAHHRARKRAPPRRSDGYNRGFTGCAVNQIVTPCLGRPSPGHRPWGVW